MRRGVLFLALTLGVFLPVSGQAMIINGSFDSGLLGWSTIGDFSIETGTFGPAGDPKLVLTSNPGSQVPLGTGAVPADPDVINFMGISAATLEANDPPGFDAFQGSAALQQFSVGFAATDIEFDFQLFTDETNFSPPYPDFGLFHVRNLAGTYSFTTLFVDVATENTAGNFGPSATVYNSETAVNTVTMPLAGADTYIFSVAIFDVDDAAFDSALALDNFTLLPEPRAYGLLLMGLAGLLCAGRAPRSR